MLCLKPILIEPGKLHGYRHSYYVPCGRCLPCRLNRTSEWTLRLLYELKSWKYASFVTLTYNDESLPIAENGRSTLVKKDVQLFMKRLRKYSGRKCKFFACGEYGSTDKTHRPHYHLILFGFNALDDNDRNYIIQAWPKCDIDIWRFKRRHNAIDIVNQYDIAYVAGYVQKKLYGRDASEEYDGIEPPFALMSQGLGLKGFNPPEIVAARSNLVTFLKACIVKQFRAISGKNSA